MTKFFLLFTSCFIAFNLNAQVFSINGEFKPRFEYRNGYGKLRPTNDSLDRAAAFITQRSRIYLNYADSNQRLKLGAALQDIRNWGVTEQQNIGDKNTLDLHEFWAELLLSNNLSLKAGRQELNYDNARIIGNSDWTQQARSFDAALLKFEHQKKRFKLHFGVGLNSKSETLSKDVYDVANYKHMQLLWINKNFKNLNSSFLFLNNGVEYTVNKTIPVTSANRKTAFSQTAGGRLEYNLSKFALNTEGYYQTGRDATNKKLNAWDLGAELIARPSTYFSVIAGAEILSGTAMDETDNKNHSFSPIYGTNHKFNGTIDYFFVGGRLANKTGLEDYYVSLKYIGKRFNAQLAPHAFYSMAKVVKDANRLDSFLALEADLSAGYKISDIATIQGGLSVLKGSSTLEYLNPGGDRKKLSTWAWTQLIIKPKFFAVGK